MSRPGPATPQHTSSTETPGPMPAWLASARISLALLIAALAVAGGAGHSGAGWVVGVTCAVILDAGLARGLARCGADRLGPADWVTFARATLAVGIAAL